MMQEVEVLKTIQELICSFFPKNSLHYQSKTKTLTTTKNHVTVKKVSKSKKYYISARTYKMVNGKKYWSAWSQSKKA